LIKLIQKSKFKNTMSISYFKISRLKKPFIALFVLLSHVTFSQVKVEVGKTGINNMDPQTALDIKGGLRIRPFYLPIIGNQLMIPDNATNIIIEQGGAGNFLVNMGTVYEGQILYFDNLYGYIGTLPGGANVPLGVSQFIFSDGEWKQTPSPNVGISSGGWSLNGNVGTNSPTNFIGTSDNKPLSFKTNNIEKMVLSNGMPELKLKVDNFTDTVKLSLSSKDASSADYVNFNFEKNVSGLGISSQSNYSLFTQKNMLYFDALSGFMTMGSNQVDAKLGIRHRTIGYNIPQLSLIDSSSNNTSGAILEFANADRAQRFALRSLHGSVSDGSDSYLEHSRNGIISMRLRGDGNLGIGSLNPNLAGLVVNKKVGNVHAIFGDNTTGVSIESAFPGIHFNSYYNASRKTMATGFTSGLEMDPATGGINFYTSSASATGGTTASVFSRMVVDKNGNVGINKPTPIQKLDIGGTTKSTQFLVNESGNALTGITVSLTGADNVGLTSIAATGIWANGTGTNGVGLLASSSVTGFGIHATGRSKFDNTVLVNDATLSMYKGGVKTIELNPKETATSGAEMKLMNASGVVTIELDADFNDGDGRVITSELQINGGSDLSENFDVAESEVKPGMVVSIDENNEGKLKISDKAYDKKVVGIVSGANGIKPGMLMGQKESIADGEYPIALAGRVYVLTTDENEIIPGDFLVSSSKSGYATKATNSKNSQGAIIGKAMSKRNKETGFVLALVTLQ
jgi:hypothetical protein